MNILEQNHNKINGVLEFFDRMIINGYLLCFQNYCHFLYYLIQKNVKLVDFKPFALQQTNALCFHIDEYIKQLGISIQYLNSSKMNKDEIASAQLEVNPSKCCFICC